MGGGTGPRYYQHMPRSFHASRPLALAVLAVGLAGCSLVSLKSPEKPLSARDLNARILTHEYAAHFMADIAHAADAIAEASSDPAVRLNALRWKIAAVSHEIIRDAGEEARRSA